LNLQGQYTLHFLDIVEIIDDGRWSMYNKKSVAGRKQEVMMTLTIRSIPAILALSCLMIKRSANSFQYLTIATSQWRRSSSLRRRDHPKPSRNLSQQQQQQGHAGADLDDGSAVTTILLEERGNNENAPLPPSNAAIVASSSSLGRIWRISMPGETANEQDEGISSSSSSSFVGSMGVPTFAATGGHLTSEHYNQRAPMEFHNLQDSLGGQGPAFVLKNVLDPSVCRDIIDTCERRHRHRHQHEQSSNGSSSNSNLFGSYNAGKNHHGAMQIVVSQDMIQPLATRIEKYINVQQVQELQRQMNRLVLGQEQQHDDHTSTAPSTRRARLQYAGLNQRWRIYRYAPSGQERFAPHIDAAFPPSGLSEDGSELIWDISSSTSSTTSSSSTTTISHLTILFYLNDDFDGGETNFYQPLAQQHEQDQQSPKIIASVKPVTGSCLVFPQGVGEQAVEYARQHWPLHEGAPVWPPHNPTEAEASSPKYVIRSDILFTSVPAATSRKE
jgi:hypothetical protein